MPEPSAEAQLLTLVIPVYNERDTIVENRWWSLSELFVSRERLVPSDLAIRLEAVLRQGLPENPLDISPPAPKDECRAR